MQEYFIRYSTDDEPGVEVALQGTSQGPRIFTSKRKAVATACELMSRAGVRMVRIVEVES